ncbi:hypothetical protein MUK42_09783, partial [Musa troglodytarum]
VRYGPWAVLGPHSGKLVHAENVGAKPLLQLHLHRQSRNWIADLSPKFRLWESGDRSPDVYHIVKGDIVPIIMGSKSCIPPLHLQRPLPGPGLLQPDPFGRGIHPLPGVFPFDMLPPPEIMEQKLAAQHVEMQRPAIENKSFAATHYSLGKELSAAQQELQRLQTDMGAIRADQEQQLGMLLDNISKMDS